MNKTFRNEQAIAEARKQPSASAQLPARVVSSSQSQVETVNLHYTINFDYAFDVDHKISQDELLSIIKDAVLKMREQMVPHLQEYPALIIKELEKRNLLDTSTFRPLP